MKPFFLLFVLPWMLSACSSDQTVGYDFPETYSLKHKAYPQDVYANSASSMFLVEDSILGILSSSKIPVGFTRFFSVRNDMREQSSFGNLGKGPGEFLFPCLTSRTENTLDVLDLHGRNLVSWKLTPRPDTVLVTETRRLPILSRQVMENLSSDDRYFTRLDNDHFVAVAHQGETQFFSLYDNQLNFLSFFGDAPVPGKINFLNSASFLGGNLRASNGMMLYATYDLPYVSCYRMQDGRPRKQWEDRFYPSVYQVQNEGILFDREKSFGMVRDLSIGGKYIYVLFNDTPKGQYDPAVSELSKAEIVFVYDFKGRRVARLDLDCRLTVCCVSSDDSRLYGLTETPEYQIVSFDLPKF